VASVHCSASSSRGFGVPLDDERGSCTGRAPALADDLLEELRQPFLVLEDFLALRAFVSKVTFTPLWM
jgi:hypothetical protein